MGVDMSSGDTLGLMVAVALLVTWGLMMVMPWRDDA